MGWFQKEILNNSCNLIESYGLDLHILFIMAAKDLHVLLYIWFLLILIHADGVATVTKFLKAQSWLLLWFYMLNLKVLLFMYRS